MSEFSSSEILLALFSGVIGALLAYLATYAKAKASHRAASEDIKEHIEMQVAITRALETEKLEHATQAALRADTRKCIYSFVSAFQGLTHSMCWLGWDSQARNKLRAELTHDYDLEAHRLLPEILAQQAVLSFLDKRRYLETLPLVDELFKLDVAFSQAILAYESSPQAALEELKYCYDRASRLCDQFSMALALDGVSGSQAGEAVELALSLARDRGSRRTRAKI